MVVGAALRQRPPPAPPASDPRAPDEARHQVRIKTMDIFDPLVGKVPHRLVSGPIMVTASSLGSHFQSGSEIGYG